MPMKIFLTVNFQITNNLPNNKYFKRSFHRSFIFFLNFFSFEKIEKKIKLHKNKGKTNVFVLPNLKIEIRHFYFISLNPIN